MSKLPVKFRVWDSGARQMHYSGGQYHWWSLTQDNLVMKTWNTPDGMNFEIDHEGRWIPMLSTGLKDAEGKDIYDGDILQNKHWRCIIEWCDGWRYEERRVGFTGGAPLRWPLDHPYRVIGNKWENPELLEIGEPGPMDAEGPTGIQGT